MPADPHPVQEGIERHTFGLLYDPLLPTVKDDGEWVRYSDHAQKLKEVEGERDGVGRLLDQALESFAEETDRAEKAEADLAQVKKRLEEEIFECGEAAHHANSAHDPSAAEVFEAQAEALTRVRDTLTTRPMSDCSAPTGTEETTEGFTEWELSRLSAPTEGEEPDAMAKLMNAEIQRPGKVFVWNDDGDERTGTGEWMDGEEVNALVRSLRPPATPEPEGDDWPASVLLHKSPTSPRVRIAPSGPAPGFEANWPNETRRYIPAPLYTGPARTYSPEDGHDEGATECDGCEQTKLGCLSVGEEALCAECILARANDAVAEAEKRAAPSIPVGDREADDEFDAAIRKSEGADGHRLKLDFDDGLRVSLIHPDDGCRPPTKCTICAADLTDPEAKRCYDCKDIDPTKEEYYLTSWVDEQGNELIRGSVTLPAEVVWETDYPLFHLQQLPSIPLEQGSGEAERLAKIGDALRLLAVADEDLGQLDELEEADEQYHGAADWYADDLADRGLLRSQGCPSGETFSVITPAGHRLIKEGLAEAIRLTQPELFVNPASPPLEHGEAESCRCGHERKWHGQAAGAVAGSGACEANPGCTCAQFRPAVSEADR